MLVAPVMSLFVVIMHMYFCQFVVGLQAVVPAGGDIVNVLSALLQAHRRSVAHQGQ